MPIDPVTPGLLESTPIDALSSFLRGELAAAATYEQALTHLEQPDVKLVLEQCRQSHAERAVLLGQEIWRLGQFPPETAGLWGAFAKAVERGAAMIGDRAIVEALHAGEREGLDTYEAGMVVADAAARSRMAELLLAPQKATTDKVAKLLEKLSSDD